MTQADEIAAQQREFWNGSGSKMWVEQAQGTDAALAPVLDALLVHADAKRGERVLDIGCGAGASVLALGERAGHDGQVVGLDISGPLLDLARERIGCQPHIRLELGDAATYRFPSAETDLLFSRFGVMFFGDPKAAFANMRAAMSAQGRLCFACWQKISANPWVDIPQSRVESSCRSAPRRRKEYPGSSASPIPGE